MKPLFRELAKSSDAALEERLRRGRAPEPRLLAGLEFAGYNTAAFTALLGIRKFIKGFFESEGLEGYNIPAAQNGFERPWLHRPSAEAPKRFGFYRVARVEEGMRDAAYPKALLLDYGASPRNAAWRPERVLRDYLAQPSADEPDVLLGKAYLALGPARLASNFFILERLRPSAWRP